MLDQAIQKQEEEARPAQRTAALTWCLRVVVKWLSRGCGYAGWFSCCRVILLDWHCCGSDWNYATTPANP